MAIRPTGRGQVGGGKGQTVSKNRGETIYSKDFEVVKSWRYRMGCSKEYRWMIRFLFGVIPSVAISDWIIYAG